MSQRRCGENSRLAYIRVRFLSDYSMVIPIIYKTKTLVGFKDGRSIKKMTRKSNMSVKNFLTAMF